MQQSDVRGFPKVAAPAVAFSPRPAADPAAAALAAANVTQRPAPREARGSHFRGSGGASPGRAPAAAPGAESPARGRSALAAPGGATTLLQPHADRPGEGSGLARGAVGLLETGSHGIRLVAVGAARIRQGRDSHLTGRPRIRSANRVTVKQSRRFGGLCIDTRTGPDPCLPQHRTAGPE
jgi:hypothetical protein